MRFGIRLASDIGDVARLVRIGLLAEKHGFDFCWATHDLFKRSCYPTLSVLARETQRVKLGPAVVNPYTVNPGEIAMFAASLNELAPGRVVIGLSAGALKFLEWIGIEARKPVQRTREAVVLVRKLLGGGKAELTGAEFQWTKHAYLRFPPPSQSIPIYIGGQSSRMLALAGELGDGALPILFPPEFAKAAIERIREGATKFGRDLASLDIAGCVWFSISKDKEIAQNEIKRLAAYYGPHLSRDVLSTVGLSKDDFRTAEETLSRDGIEEAVRRLGDGALRLAIAGDPDECIERVAQLQSAGITQLSIGPPLGPDPEIAVKLIGEYLIPYFASN